MRRTLYAGTFQGNAPQGMKKHLPRKPDEDGIEVKTLSDGKGFLFGGVICCDEPLRFDEHLGRTVAVVHELIKPYLWENRLVRICDHAKEVQPYHVTLSVRCGQTLFVCSIDVVNGRRRGIFPWNVHEHRSFHAAGKADERWPRSQRTPSWRQHLGVISGRSVL